MSKLVLGVALGMSLFIPSFANAHPRVVERIVVVEESPVVERVVVRNRVRRDRVVVRNRVRRVREFNRVRLLPLLVGRVEVERVRVER